MENRSRVLICSNNFCKRLYHDPTVVQVRFHYYKIMDTALYMNESRRHSYLECKIENEKYKDEKVYVLLFSQEDETNSI